MKHANSLLLLASLEGALSGCHIVSGIDGLELREDAELGFFETFSGPQRADLRALSVNGTSVLLAGSFTSAIDVGDTPLTTSASEDGYVVRLDASGRVTDAFKLASTEWARPAALHGSWLAGHFAGEITIGGATLSAGTGATSVFLADLAATPASVPTQVFGGDGFIPFRDTLDIAQNEGGRVVVGGGFAGKLVNPGDPRVCPPFESASSLSNIYLAELAPDPDSGGSLTCKWSFRQSSSEPQVVESVAFDLGGSLVVGGQFVGKLALPGVDPLESSGGVDFFLVRFDPSKKVVYSKSFGDGQGVQSSLRVSAHLYGNVAIAGFFEGRIDFGGGPIESSQGSDIVVAKFGPAGKHLFTRHFPVSHAACAMPPCAPHGLDVAFDADGNILVTSAFTGKIEISGVKLETASPERAEHFLAKLNPDGDLMWSGRFGGAASACEPGPCPVVLGVDGAQNVLVAGYFEGAADFGGALLNSTGARDAFVARFSP
ncbi:MAG: hypothetical protein EXR75_05495 [Myxococcales bacterium]|nr:hypothetical protein [Myxococcales bacterium]